MPVIDCQDCLRNAGLNEDLAQAADAQHIGTADKMAVFYRRIAGLYRSAAAHQSDFDLRLAQELEGSGNPFDDKKTS
jgi:hypothetical protein